MLIIFLQKVVRICENEWKRAHFVEWCNSNLTGYNLDFEFKCDNLTTVHQNGLCLKENSKPSTEDLQKYSDLVQLIIKYTKENIAYVKFYMSEPFYTKTLRDVSITPISFVGNTGGLISLCLGLSFISIFEAFYHLTK